MKPTVMGVALALASLRAFPAASPPDVALFFQAASRDEKAAGAALVALSASWRDGYTGMIVDLARLTRSPRRGGSVDAEPGRGQGFDEAEPGISSPGRFGFSPPPDKREPVDPTSLVRARLLGFLGKRTGQRFGDDLGAWRRWLWSQPYDPHPDLARFKSTLYAGIDPRMAAFFPPGARAAIRLDEVDWGGVPVNGIPPLDHPRHVPAREADYLKETNVVFGIAVNGEARAYPKRTLAWHELARDRLAGVELAIVYCTLCGTVIPYGAELGGVRRTFGTSGLLYRSNKLMFEVPRTDKRLKNKAEVVALLVRPPGASSGPARLPLALAVDYLERNPVHQRTFAGRELLFVTSPDGATRVYESGPARFARLRADGSVEDSLGGIWQATEDALLPESPGTAPLPRVPARSAFWFGWQAQFPETELVR